MTDLQNPPFTSTPVSLSKKYSLTDRIRKDTGAVFASGVQAIARVLVEQLRVDRANGLNTAAFASGYPGSPLAGLDRELATVAKMVQGDLPLVFRPGSNEELAATAVMGSQLAQRHGESLYDGVIGLWFAKAPGLDRACDAIRHAVFCGTHPLGGVLCVVGDDPGAKSSTLPSSSDATMVDLHMPILYPVSVQDTLDLGRHGIALSRASGLWSGLKVVANVADGTSSIHLDPYRVQPVMPEWLIDGSHYQPKPDPLLIPPHNLALEQEILEVRLEVARKYGLVNQLNRVEVEPGSSARIGIAACGYTYGELREALARLGFADDDSLKRAGIRLMSLRMPFPLDASVMRAFAHDLEEVIVVEEKNPTLEWLIKDALWGSAERPLIVGKRDVDGSMLFARSGHLDADAIVAPLRRRLAARLGDDALREIDSPREHIAVVDARSPWFCSGCPHNWGTKVPEGSLYGAGIGCHVMTTLQESDRVGELASLCAMGGEGLAWTGMEPFVTRNHFIQNLGDGTYAHSGQLAVQAAVAAKSNITFKILFNGAVAMTGGQDAPGQMSVSDMVEVLLRQGVARVLITTDDVNDYRSVVLPKGVEVWDRTRIVEAQELLRSIQGTTVLIHEQPCAAELRRDRKRGIATTPTLRVLINERVCEGCGDCGEKSACLSVQPVETEFGRKTRIDQTSCNLDLSCIQGDCPSFMTVEVDPSRLVGAQANTHAGANEAPTSPEPTRIFFGDVCTIRLAGIGGTGVVTVSQVLGTAALLEGREVMGLDQTGLSQKAGPVVSDLRIGNGTDSLHGSNKAGAGATDVLLAFDLLVGAHEANLSTLHADSIVVASSAPTPTGARVVHPERQTSSEPELLARIAEVTSLRPIIGNASARTTALFGDAATANMLVIGMAYQAGALPVGASAIEEAIALNGVAVERNVSAFRWGRALVANPSMVEAGLADAEPSSTERPDVSSLSPRLARRLDAFSIDAPVGSPLIELLRSRTRELVAFQNEKCAASFLDVVERVARRERAVSADRKLTEAVARYLFQLTAYKDEYEVARLLVAPETQAAAERIGGPKAKVTYRLHPPMLRALGVSSKIKLGPMSRPVLVALAAAKPLRGTALDPFGRMHVRKLERQLRDEYVAAIETLTTGLTVENHAHAVRIASLPESVRGYEERKVTRSATYREQLDCELRLFRGAASTELSV